VNMLIGEILTSLFGVTKEEIEKALQVRNKVGGYVGQVLLQMGSITETQLIAALSEQLTIAIFDKDVHRVDQEKMASFLFNKIDLDLMLKNNLVPVDVDHDRQILLIVTNDPVSDYLAPYIVQRTGFNIVYLLATEQVVKELSGLYSTAKTSDFVSLHVEDSPEKLKEMAFEAPVIKFLNNLLSRAVELRATDLHIQPADNNYWVRFRIDGLLHDIEFLDEPFTLPRSRESSSCPGWILRKRGFPRTAN